MIKHNIFTRFFAIASENWNFVHRNLWYTSSEDWAWLKNEMTIKKTVRSAVGNDRSIEFFSICDFHKKCFGFGNLQPLHFIYQWRKNVKGNLLMYLLSVKLHIFILFIVWSTWHKNMSNCKYATLTDTKFDYAFCVCSKILFSFCTRPIADLPGRVLHNLTQAAKVHGTNSAALHISVLFMCLGALTAAQVFCFCGNFVHVLQEFRFRHQLTNLFRVFGL